MDAEEVAELLTRQAHIRELKAQLAHNAAQHGNNEQSNSNNDRIITQTLLKARDALTWQHYSFIEQNHQATTTPPPTPKPPSRILILGHSCQIIMYVPETCTFDDLKRACEKMFTDTGSLHVNISSSNLFKGCKPEDSSANVLRYLRELALSGDRGFGYGGEQQSSLLPPPLYYMAEVDLVAAQSRRRMSVTLATLQKHHSSPDPPPPPPVVSKTIKHRRVLCSPFEAFALYTIRYDGTGIGQEVQDAKKVLELAWLLQDSPARMSCVMFERALGIDGKSVFKTIFGELTHQGITSHPAHTISYREFMRHWNKLADCEIEQGQSITVRDATLHRLVDWRDSFRRCCASSVHVPVPRRAWGRQVSCVLLTVVFALLITCAVQFFPVSTILMVAMSAPNVNVPQGSPLLSVSGIFTEFLAIPSTWPTFLFDNTYNTVNSVVKQSRVSSSLGIYPWYSLQHLSMSPITSANGTWDTFSWHVTNQTLWGWYGTQYDTSGFAALTATADTYGVDVSTRAVVAEANIFVHNMNDLFWRVSYLFELDPLGGISASQWLYFQWVSNTSNLVLTALASVFAGLACVCGALTIRLSMSPPGRVGSNLVIQNSLDWTVAILALCCACICAGATGVVEYDTVSSLVAVALVLSAVALSLTIASLERSWSELPMTFILHSVPILWLLVILTCSVLSFAICLYFWGTGLVMGDVTYDLFGPSNFYSCVYEAFVMCLSQVYFYNVFGGNDAIGLVVNDYSVYVLLGLLALVGGIIRFSIIALVVDHVVRRLERLDAMSMRGRVDGMNWGVWSMSRHHSGGEGL